MISIFAKSEERRKKYEEKTMTLEEEEIKRKKKKQKKKKKRKNLTELVVYRVSVRKCRNRLDAALSKVCLKYGLFEFTNFAF